MSRALGGSSGSSRLAASTASSMAASIRRESSSMRAWRARPAARCRSSSRGVEGGLGRADQRDGQRGAGRGLRAGVGIVVGVGAVDQLGDARVQVEGGLGRTASGATGSPTRVKPATRSRRTSSSARRVSAQALPEGDGGVLGARRRPDRRRRRERDPARRRRAAPRHRRAASSPGPRSPDDAGLRVARAHCARRPRRCRARVRERAVPRPIASHASEARHASSPSGASRPRSSSAGSGPLRRRGRGPGCGRPAWRRTGAGRRCRTAPASRRRWPARPRRRRARWPRRSLTVTGLGELQVASSRRRRRRRAAAP